MATLELERYREYAPDGALDLLFRTAAQVRGRRLVHVNSTRVGGGVAEILHRMVPLMRELEVDAQWAVLDGDADFFATTKAFHNALQGEEAPLTEAMLAHYLKVNRANARRLRLDGDFVLVHDPQPAPLIESRPATGAWVWRCHIDLSAPAERAWGFLRSYVNRYDRVVVSLEAYARHVTVPHAVVPPSIDPLAEKNRPMGSDEIGRVLDAVGVPADKPLLVQVSRFDRFKDPLGVIAAYRLVKRRHDVRLVLAGGGATDDPEGGRVLAEVREAAGLDPDIRVLDLPPDAHRTINALQRAATIVLQKSTREGFGLTVAEAMWKGRPVIGGRVGGITLQVLEGVTGYTVVSPEEAAARACHLLAHPEEARAMGERGREHVRQHFLITRHLFDYLALMLRLTA
ncbi:MAG: glycosyltransferase [Candidatus Rokuibacteriota bacterium]